MARSYTRALGAVLKWLVLAGSVAADTSNRRLTSCDVSVTLNASTNVWNDYRLHRNNIYHDIVVRAVENFTDSTEKQTAIRIAETGSFAWIESSDDIRNIAALVQDVPCTTIVGLVVAGLPYKTCSTSVSAPTDDLWDYIADFINPIVAEIAARRNTAFAIILEPGVMPNYALAPNGTCQNVKESWYRNVPRALKALDLPNVVMYLDGGHGGVFGWTGRPWEGTTKAPKWFHQYEGTALQGATELTETWKAAGPLNQFRGLAVNVRGYNSWDMSPGESFVGETTCYDLYNKGRNEQRYLNYLLNAGLLKINSTMPFKNIMDTTRSGQQGVRENWSDWCNVNGAANGPKPRAVTGNNNLDAFVWASGIGVSDGTSDPSSGEYNADCAGLVSFKPMPKRGEFSLGYFRMMLGWCKGCLKKKGIARLLGRCG